MLADPGADLRGVAEQAKQVRVNLLHELTQPLPARTRHIGGDIQFEEKDRLAIEMTQPLLAEQRQLQTLEPVPRKQNTAVVDQELLPAMHHCPAPRQRGVEQRRLPAQAHQAATGMPSARTLSLARSSTLSRESSRRRIAPPSR